MKVTSAQKDLLVQRAQRLKAQAEQRERELSAMRESYGVAPPPMALPQLAQRELLYVQASEEACAAIVLANLVETE